MTNFSRRTVLQLMGIQVALPLLSTVIPAARAATNPRSRFIAVYFPNGAYMPSGANGSWNWDESLQPLTAFKQNTIVLRGLRNGFRGNDPHWQNCAGYLSCKPIELGDPGIARCGKTLDQYVADAHPSALRSLEIGGIYYYVHPLSDHPGYSTDYNNRISWEADDKFRIPEPDPARLFQRLFSVSPEGADQLAYLRARRRSVLDHVYKDAERLSMRLPKAYQPVLESHMETVRGLELKLSDPAVQGGGSCAGGLAAPTGDFSRANQNYLPRFQLMHEMVVLALQCGQTNVASIMYGPAVSDQLDFSESIGGYGDHHSSAHHKGFSESIARIKAITKVQTGLLADLLTRLKAANLLDSTLVMYGSDMSDGDAHLGKNLPVLLCGGGSDLKFGQEIGSAQTERPLSDLHMEVLSLMGINNITSFGAGECLSTGQPLGIRV